jgi:DNA-binding IclR family transcriptional regulator
MDQTGAEPADVAVSGGVDAVDRALRIMRVFDVGRERLSLADLANETGLYKSTILRLTVSLERSGLLHREPDGRFIVGPECLRLAAVYRRLPQLESRVRPALLRLRDATGESASFFQRVGDRRQCVYREETHRTVRDHVIEGDLLPLEVGAAGRVLKSFAGASGAERGRLSEDLPIVSFGERDPEVTAIAVPVFDHDGLRGALTISGPRSRLTSERVDEIVPTLIAEGEALSRLLGGDIPHPSR